MQSNQNVQVEDMDHLDPATKDMLVAHKQAFQQELNALLAKYSVANYAVGVSLPVESLLEKGTVGLVPEDNLVFVQSDCKNERAYSRMADMLIPGMVKMLVKVKMREQGFANFLKQMGIDPTKQAMA